MARDLWRTPLLEVFCIVAGALLSAAMAGQTSTPEVVQLKGDAGGKRFDGIGVVDGGGGEKVLSTVNVANISPDQWHNLKLRFEGSTIAGFVDDKPVLSATDSLYPHGMAGLMAGGTQKKLSTAYFDNVLIKGPNAPVPSPSSAMPGQSPIYQSPEPTP